MRIADIGIEAAIDLLLPHFVAAGSLACRIQDDIVRNGNRNGDAKTGDRFTEALTDADIAVETYLATVLLTSFEDVSFYGEEYERDRVSAYFPKDAPYLVTLDPVDGTLYFKDGLPIFSTILTICTGGAIAAAIVYQPREERFYVAIKGKGATTTTAADVAAGRAPMPHRLTTHGNVLLLGTNFRDRQDAFEQAGFEVVTPSVDYDGSLTWEKTSVRMLAGKIAGMAFSKAQLIDAGAIAFIAVEAGGKDNGPTYGSETRRAEPLIVGADPETYDTIAGIIAAQR
ncbi:MAG TPA: inositol monophosphatase family protein [Candidatus Eisenbacteria bacterium]|nr:inositol monophosphatase family protein [Candidatus Eisenbacteria bacterium]